MGPADGDTQTIHEEIEALLSEYVEGTLPVADTERVAAHLAGCAGCRSAEADERAIRAQLGSLRPQAAPAELREQVTDTIHRRSAGRFFARRTLGDRVPLGLLLVVALAMLLTIVAALWASATGSLRDPPSRPEAPPATGEPVVPAP